jgi:hypothetical protein
MALIHHKLATSQSIQALVLIELLLDKQAAIFISMQAMMMITFKINQHHMAPGIARAATQSTAVQVMTPSLAETIEPNQTVPTPSTSTAVMATIQSML